MSTQTTMTWHDIPRNEIDWHPTVIADRCIGCGLCVTSCGRGVYAFLLAGWQPAQEVEDKHCRFRSAQPGISKWVQAGNHNHVAIAKALTGNDWMGIGNCQWC